MNKSILTPILLTISLFFTTQIFAQLHSGTFTNTMDFTSSNLIGAGTTSYTNVDGTEVDFEFSWDQTPPDYSPIYDDGTYSGLSGGSAFMYTATGLGSDSYTMCLNIRDGNVTDMGFDVTHINYPGFGGGDMVTITAQAADGSVLTPTFTQPSNVDYTLSGNNADAFGFDTAPEYNLGVNISSSASNPITQVCIEWEECSSCGVGEHGIGMSDINFKEACTANEVTLTLNFDDYPAETSWQIANDDGTIVANGGSYSNSLAGTTLIKSICLEDDCYTFTIFDSWSDGMCCSWGNGSYSLTMADGTVLASGASFGASESSDFCLSGTGLLPVELLFFSADEKEDNVALEWATASEEDNAYFEVERSLDGHDWESIDKIAGAGNSTIEINYTSLDDRPYAGLSYYRLKQVDYDGTFTYSDIETITFTEREVSDINVYPVPANDYVYLESTEALDNSNVRLMNNLGQTLNVPIIENGTYRIGFDISNLDKGMYFLQLTEGNNQTVKKIFVQ
jgi:hypothetical protein